MRAADLGAGLLIASALLAVSCADEQPRTETVVELAAERAVRDATTVLDVRIWGLSQRDAPTGDEPSWERRYELDDIRWPLRIGVVPRDDDAGRAFEVEALARDGDTLVGKVGARSGYAARRTLWLRLDVDPTCPGLMCSGGQLCRDGACRDRFVDPADLEDFPSDAGTPDAGADAGPPCEPPEPGDHAAANDGRCYLLIERDSWTWQTGRNECELSGADLASITSLTEQQFVASFLEDAAAVETTQVWIGGRRDDADPAEWVWMSGEDFATFERWTSGSRPMPAPPIDHRVLMIQSESWTWGSYGGEGATWPIVCERAL